MILGEARDRRAFTVANCTCSHSSSFNDTKIGTWHSFGDYYNDEAGAIDGSYAYERVLPHPDVSERASGVSPRHQQSRAHLGPTGK